MSVISFDANPSLIVYDLILNKSGDKLLQIIWLRPLSVPTQTHSLVIKSEDILFSIEYLDALIEKAEHRW